MTPQELVEALWERFSRLEFAAVAPLLHDDFICEWPQSRERIRGREHYITINQHYPGQWQIEIERLAVTPTQVVSQLKLTFEDKVDYAVAFFEFKDGLIVKEVDFWASPYPAPDWRKQWVETM